ncbi:MAG: DUF4375 domain-containing protein [Phycisphaerales bacterium]|nr:DUF4375 domain-containing protein [Phycisphaerales bacterium]
MRTTTWIIVALILGIAYGIPLLRRQFLHRDKAMKKFARRLADDPAYAASVSRGLDRRERLVDAANAAPPPAGSEIPALIDDLLGTDADAQVAADIRLSKSLLLAEPILLAAFEDPRCTWEQDDNSSTRSAAERVVDLLWKIPSRSLCDRISGKAEDTRWWVNSNAVKARAASGSAECAQRVLRDLASAERIRAEAAENGVDLSIEQGWAEPAFVATILDWARHRACDDSVPPSAWAVAFYARHGGEDAIRALQGPEVLSLENNRTIHFVLEALNKLRIGVDPVLLRAMIEKSLASGGKWPWGHVLPPGLEALARIDPAAARATAIANVGNPVDLFARASREFIRRAEGLPKPWNAKPPDSMALTAEEEAVLHAMRLVSEVHGQVGNGGMSQYFFNPSGGHWPDAVRAFRMIGFNEGADALEKAARIVDAGGASLDRDERIKQYARLSKEKEGQLDALSPIIWKGTDEAELLFMLKHADLFRRIKAAQIAAGISGPGELD